MTSLALIALSAFQTETTAAPPAPAQDPWERSEWQLVSDPLIFGTSGSWTGEFLAAEPTPIPPIRARDWIFAPRELCDEFAGPLAPWILDPNTTPPASAPGEESASKPASRWLASPPSASTAPVFAYTTVECADEEARLAKMPGVEWLLSNGELFVGDPLRRGFLGVPAPLARGTNRLFVKARDAKFDVVFEKPLTRLVLEDQDVRWPGEGGSPEVFDDANSWGVISFPVFNVSSLPVSYLHHHYGKPTQWNATCRPNVCEWRDGSQIAPLGMQGAWHFYWNFDATCDSSSGDTPRDVWLPEALHDVKDELEERKVLRRPVDPKKRVSNNVVNVMHAEETAVLPFASNLRCSLLLQGSLRRASAYDGLARFHQQSDWYHSGRIGERYADGGYPSSLWGAGPRRTSAGPPIAIFGNRDTFKGWNNFVPDEPSFRARDGSVEIEGVEYRGDDLAGWTIVRSPQRTLRIVFDTGARGARLALLLATTWTGEVPDTAVFRIDPTEARGWRRLAVPRPR